MSYIAAWTAAQFCNKNSKLAVEHSKKILEYAIISKDKFFYGFGNFLKETAMSGIAWSTEDPDRQKEIYKKIIDIA
ncbi:MAG: hypothetical protein P8Y18_06280 [Candidatus Bathyarchaeota archaeon]